MKKNYAPNNWFFDEDEIKYAFYMYVGEGNIIRGQLRHKQLKLEKNLIDLERNLKQGNSEAKNAIEYILKEIKKIEKERFKYENIYK